MSVKSNLLVINRNIDLHTSRTHCTSGHPSWMMQLLGAQEITPGDIHLCSRSLPRRLDTVEQAIEMLQGDS